MMSMGPYDLTVNKNKGKSGFLSFLLMSHWFNAITKFYYPNANYMNQREQLWQPLTHGNRINQTPLKMDWIEFYEDNDQVKLRFEELKLNLILLNYNKHKW